MWKQLVWKQLVWKQLVWKQLVWKRATRPLNLQPPACANNRSFPKLRTASRLSFLGASSMKLTPGRIF